MDKRMIDYLPSVFPKHEESKNWKFFQLFQETYDKFKTQTETLDVLRDIQTAQGAALDKIGEVWGLYRTREELTDELYRTLILIRLHSRREDTSVNGILRAIRYVYAEEAEDFRIVPGSKPFSISLDNLPTKALTNLRERNQLATLARKLQTAGVVVEGLRFDDGQEDDVYECLLTSSNGSTLNAVRNSTALSARVFKNGTEITDSLNENLFSWVRVSGSVAEDATFNSQARTGKTFTFRYEDFDSIAHFCCIVTDENELNTSGQFTLSKDSTSVIVQISTPDGTQSSEEGQLIIPQGTGLITLVATVWKGGVNITEELPLNYFRWVKEDKDGNTDEYWSRHQGFGVKSVLVSKNDIYIQATYRCIITGIL